MTLMLSPWRIDPTCQMPVFMKAVNATRHTRMTVFNPSRHTVTLRSRYAGQRNARHVLL